ncbi:MAG: ribonuclease P protein component [Variibacter sp.]
MERLRRRADFVAAAGGKRAYSAGFVLQARRRDDAEAPRLGLTVSRKVGNAVERNRVRRRLREAIKRAESENIQAGHDYVVVARREVLTRPFEALIADFAGTLRRLETGERRSPGHRRTKPPQSRLPRDGAAGDESGQ